MKKNEQSLEILEMIKGGMASYEKRFPNKNIVAITDTHIAFGELASKALALKNGNKLLLAKSGDRMFVSVPSEMSNVKAYKIKFHGGRHMVSSRPYLTVNNVKRGYYNMATKAIFYRDLDWYELEFLEEYIGRVYKNGTFSKKNTVQC